MASPSPSTQAVLDVIPTMLATSAAVTVIDAVPGMKRKKRKKKKKKTKKRKARIHYFPLR